MDRITQKFLIFDNLAFELAGLSTCKRLSSRRGAVIIDVGFTAVYAIGYNGPPAGQPNDGCRNIVGHCGCVHAEANALLKLNTHEHGLIMVCTATPCAMCASMIINSRRIFRLCCRDLYRDEAGLQLLEDAGIEVRLNYDNIQQWWDPNSGCERTTRNPKCKRSILGFGNY